MNNALAFLLALVLAGPAVAQVQQSGNVTPGHPAMWATTGVIQDGGSVSTPALTNVGVLNSGLGICDQNLPTSASYVQLCLGFAGGVPTIFANGPGMGSLLNFNINGVTTSFGPAGPDLPLTGGTVTGATTLSGAGTGLTVTNNATLGNGGVSIYNQPYYGNTGEVDANTFGPGPLTGKRALGSGGNLAPYLYLTDALSGTKTGGVSTLAYIATASDTLNAGAGGIQGLRVDLNGGGAGAVGNRVGIYSNLVFAGTNGVKTANSGLYSPLWAYGYVSGNVGGTSGSGNAYGSLWGGVISATLQSGATYWQEAIGLEVDVGVSTGASASYVQGEKIVLQQHNQATSAADYMLGFTSGGIANTGLGSGISFGSPDGWWPFATTASLITTTPPNASLPGGTGPAYAAALGIDLSAVTFSTGAFKSNGFLVNPTGVVTGASYVAGSTAGVASKTCTISALGATITITGGIVTATSGC